MRIRVSSSLPQTLLLTGSTESGRALASWIKKFLLTISDALYIREGKESAYLTTCYPELSKGSAAGKVKYFLMGEKLF